MRQPIAIIRGTTKTLNINISQVAGESYVLADGEILRFGVKKSPEHSAYVIKKNLTSANYDNGVYVLTLTPEDTEQLNYGCYYYDVGLQVGSEYFNVIECSEFDIRHSITTREAVE